MLHLLTVTLKVCQRRLSHSFVYHNSAIHCSSISSFGSRGYRSRISQHELLVPIRSETASITHGERQ